MLYIVTVEEVIESVLNSTPCKSFITVERRYGTKLNVKQHPPSPLRTAYNVHFNPLPHYVVRFPLCAADILFAAPTNQYIIGACLIIVN